MSIKNQLEAILIDSLNKNNLDVSENLINISPTKEAIHGDYTTNLAMLLTKELHKNPIDIANMIKDSISSSIIEKIEVAPPGFINFFISKERLCEEINIINKETKKYGSSNIGNNKKVNIEYVSANPTGTLHIGHGRGATYGDNLSRIMSFCGYDVTREYYINDAGNQMNNLGISIKERYKEICGLKFEIPEDGYHGKEIIELAQKIYDENKDNLLDEDISYFKQAGLKILLDAIKKDLDAFRVNFDVFTSEQSLYDKGEVENVLSTFKKSNNCYVEDNALWLKTSNYTDEKDRVIVKSDGSYTYLLPDIAYHVNKLHRGFDMLIDVFGADHHGYINRLKSSLEILNEPSNKLEVKILQMVRLLKNGEEIKISKRTGKTITLNELLEEVGINATRYFFASKSPDTQMDFDMTLATSNSNDNPVYYIEYANARITSILNTYREEIPTDISFKTIEEPIAYNIMNKLSSFEETIASACNKQEPHIICNYVYDLAAMFHSYYSKEKFITDDKEYTKERMALLNAIKIVINNSLNLLGIIPREHM